MLSRQELVAGSSIRAQIRMSASKYLQTNSGSLKMALINPVTLPELGIRGKSPRREEPATWQQIRDRGEKLVRETFPEGNGVSEEISRNAMSRI